ncbi:MAG TPA: CAP domain-containing protein [Thermoanaerobaculia bacterium]
MNFQRITAVAVALSLAVPLSLFAETRSRQRTEMQALAADLQRALGGDRVEIDGSPRYRRTSGNFEDAIVEAMNRQRAAYGLGALRTNSRLSLAANDRVGDLFAKHYFDHVSPDGLQPWTWVQRRGYRYRLIGENLAVGYPSAFAVVDGWMHSPGHRANILRRGFDEVGVAVGSGAPTRGYGGPTVVALYGHQ